MHASKFMVVMALGMQLTGCVSNPATGIQSSGGPLKVRYADGTGTYVSNDVISEDKIVNSETGEETGQSIQHTADVKHSFHWSNWTYHQGRQALDEQDFYRLSGDTDAYDKILQIRNRAALKQKIGIAIGIVGALTGLYIIGKASKETSPADSKHLTNIGLYTGFGIGAIGGLVWTWGAYQMRNKHHLAMERADANADVIETCHESRCTRERGGHRAEVPPPPPRGEIDSRLPHRVGMRMR